MATSGPSPYFGGAPNALLGGYEFARDQQARQLKENALNAMIQKYGPEAADPVALGQLETITQRRELHPYDVAAAERQKAAQDALTGQYGAISGDPNAVASEGVQREARRRAGLAAATVLQKVKQDGGDLGAAFDRLMPILPSLGFDASQLPRIRKQILEDPDFADELMAMLQAGGMEGAIRATGNPIPVYDERGNLRLMQQMSDGTTRIVPGVTPAGAAQAEVRLGQGDRRLTNEEARMRGFNAPSGYEAWLDENTGVVSMAPVRNTRQAQEFESELREADQADTTYTLQAEIFRRRAETIDDAAARALEYFDSARGGILLQNIRRGTQILPGTEAYAARAALDAIKNNLAMDELDAMRQSSVNGSSGFGQLTERELELLKNSRGLLETTHDPAIIATTLRRIVEDVARMRSIVTADEAAATQRRAERRQLYGDQLRAPSAPPRGAQQSAPGPVEMDLPPLSDEALRYLELYGQ